MRIRELRAEARNALKGNLKKVTLSVFWSLAIPALLASLGSNAVVRLALSAGWLVSILVGIVFAVVGVILTVYLSYGVVISVMKVSRNEESHYFKDTFLKENRKCAMAAFGGLASKLWFWILLALVGGIVPVIGIVLVIVGVVECMVELYNYFLINYLKYDYPDNSVKELLAKSKMMMRGNRAKAIVIPLTLIVWFILNYLATIGISLVLNMIWPPQLTLFGTVVSTVPLFVQIIEYIVSLLLSAMLTGYLNMINYQLYMEQKPLEIYNDDYIKPETNAKKYIGILIGVIGAYIAVIIGMGLIIHLRAMSIIL